MKHRIAHLFYLGVLLGGSLFFWRTLHRERQLLTFLHRPTDEAYIVLRQQNREMKEEVESTTFAYSSDRNVRERHRIQQTDSLVKVALSGRLTRGELRNSLAALMAHDTMIVNKLMQGLPAQDLQDWSPDTYFMRPQNDSLRYQLALTTLLHYFTNLVGGEGIKDAIRPWASFTTLCPVGQPTEVDVFMGTADNWSEVTQIRVNGQPLSMEEGVVSFQHTFLAPGIYPLKVEAKASFYNGQNNSAFIIEKTFFLNVSQ